jgi:hypothetical protein
MVVNMNLILACTASEEHSIDFPEDDFNILLIGKSVDGDYLCSRHPNVLHVGS